MRWKYIIHLLGINFLVLLFTYAGLSKLLEREAFYFGSVQIHGSMERERIRAPSRE